jgi:hypothetical protein
MLMSIPVISPIELTMPAYEKLLAAPDESGIQDAEYTVETTETTTGPAAPAAAFLVATPALLALSQIEQAAELGNYHEFGWWRERINTIRDVVKRAEAFEPGA